MRLILATLLLVILTGCAKKPNRYLPPPPSCMDKINTGVLLDGRSWSFATRLCTDAKQPSQAECRLGKKFVKCDEKFFETVGLI
jgi:hypothetical protein